jgi:hypothetical protein
MRAVRPALENGVSLAGGPRPGSSGGNAVVTSPTDVDRKKVVRLGNAWLWYSFFVFYAACMAGIVSICVSAIASGGPKDTGLRFGVLLSVVPAAVILSLLLVVMGIVVVRNPRILGRAVVLTPTELRMPQRKQGRIPLDDVAGVGLALQQGTYGRGGMWGMMVWRSDGSHVWAGDIQRKAALATPERTRVGIAATQVYRYVLAHQGPDGLLAQRAVQRNPHFSRYSAYTRFWDPATA